MAPNDLENKWCFNNVHNGCENNIAPCSEANIKLINHNIWLVTNCLTKQTERQPQIDNEQCFYSWLDNSVSCRECFIHDLQTNVWIIMQNYNINRPLIHNLVTQYPPKKDCVPDCTCQVDHQTITSKSCEYKQLFKNPKCLGYIASFVLCTYRSTWSPVTEFVSNPQAMRCRCQLH